MERFYVLRLLSFAHRCPGYLRLAKHFLCHGWDTINMDLIQKSNVENEFFVPSAQNANFYVVNSEIGTCSCPIGMTGAPCKHQGAVSVKFHLSTFNFIPSLTSNDRMVYAYIALGYIAKDSSFYASLHAEFTSQSLQTESETSNSNTTIEYGILSHKETNLMVNLRSGSMIRVQVESVKRRKTEGSGCKWKLPNTIKDKENLDPQNIPS
ncbi:hypothetical protein RhiirC2_718369 [Rhizophagus irregularis]|uniref:SWIM-type domain-containing protein n=1 Tax=Rhizophagus irregularis TaxID=588596 RepID=A0A2N1MIN2_9GLOM|nr:hypothetical protein RhiirC2_718369 [Rhizophagus irregularis]